MTRLALPTFCLAQPGFKPYRDEESGYGLSPADRGEAERFVNDCLSCVAEERKEHTLVVFPEASVPVASVDRIVRFISSDCPNNTVIVAGLEGMTVNDALEYDNLPFAAAMRQQMIETTPRHHRFLNACLVLVRDGDGAAHSHLQTKLHPSNAEQTLPSMFSSDSVLLFTCPQLSFMVLICSDLIQRPPPDGWLPVGAVNAVKDAWEATGVATSLSIDLIVNIQCNPKPNHQSFREGLKSILCHRTDTVRLDTASVLISNWGHLWDNLEPLLASGIVYQTAFWRTPRDTEPDVPVGYSFTTDEVNGLNIAAFRSFEHGRCRFQMMPCAQAEHTDPSRRLPLKDSSFERLDDAGSWVTMQQSPWRDRCNRWLPGKLPGSASAHFWSVPNNDEVQKEIYATYSDTRRRILEKSDTDLRHNLLCLVLQSDRRNPDMWGQQQYIALNKWASIATLFYYVDESLDFRGDEWFSFMWRRKVCIAVIDGENSATCAKSLAIYSSRFGLRLPKDPASPVTLVLLLYRHTRDRREDLRRVAPLAENGWNQPRASQQGVRREALAEDPEDIANPKSRPRLFWGSAESLDIALESRDKTTMQEVLEAICGPALD